MHIIPLSVGRVAHKAAIRPEGLAHAYRLLPGREPIRVGFPNLTIPS